MAKHAPNYSMSALEAISGDSLSNAISSDGYAQQQEAYKAAMRASDFSELQSIVYMTDAYVQAGDKLLRARARLHEELHEYLIR